jgi:hypothetical protein
MKSKKYAHKCLGATGQANKSYPHKDGGIKALSIEGLFHFTCFHFLSVTVNDLQCVAG